ncbi:calcium-transporting ATPase 12, plasma membrane-type-like [Ziziphus jujuba]|uniref:Calcium-transporting ATPase 12, plasma membrane-type-like n=1 Tax=Ziziphus jujuba TaxID=326968 RepID=A0ABM4A3V1_ZIZJJ|nr:calcium-transporting ATPase 12, plasma membrane-type-like [Ziziphus jujuba]
MDAVMSNKQIKHKKIMNVVKEKDLEGLNKRLKGIKGVAKTLETDINNGIDDDEKKIAQRRKNFGSNAYKKPPPEGFLRTTWRPLQEFAILNKLMNILAALILFLAATAVGSYVPSAHKSKEVMMDGHKIEVLRSARRRKISTSEIVVGDVVCLKMGDKVPADGLFLKGQNLQVEDGESADAVQVNEQNPFLFSGSQVVDGYGGCQMMVTTVGMKKKWCEIMSQHSHDGKSDEEEEIPTVENRVNQLIRSIRNKLALPVALIGSAVVLVRYFTGTTKDIDGNQEFIDGHTTHGDFFGSSVLKFVAAAFVTVVVAIPESLRLCVPLTVFYSKKRMMADMEMVSDLSGWEKMPFVTTICTDKTGTLSVNQMKVETFWVGKYRLVNEAYFSNVSDSLKNLLEEGIALNTSGSVRKSTTPTDKAILSWAVHDLEMDMGVKSTCKVVNLAAFDSQKKRSGVLMEREVDKTVHVHWKGEAEVILEMCSSYYDISGTTSEDLGAEQKAAFQRNIQVMKESSLQCIAFAHIEDQAADATTGDQTDGSRQTLKEDGLVLLALVGINDPSLPQMKSVVEDCQKAGIDVKMFTGNDVSMAKDIARGCGILTGTPNQEEGEVIKGEQFRVYSPNERNEKVDKIRVMENSSPDDKLLMVKTLKKRGHIVAVCGNATNGDAWAMIEADVGISMGIREGTGAGGIGVSSKKISDIVILDGNFASVLKVVRSSIGIYNNIQKFIQFQLTLNLATLALLPQRSPLKNRSETGGHLIGVGKRKCHHSYP